MSAQRLSPATGDALASRASADVPAALVTPQGLRVRVLTSETGEKTYRVSAAPAARTTPLIVKVTAVPR